MPDIARTLDFSATNPDFSNETGAVTGAIRDLILDPWRPKTRAFALSGGTSGGVFRAADWNAADPTWTHILDVSDVTSLTGETPGDPSNVFDFKLVCSINQDGFICTTARAGGKAWFLKSTDGGDNWTAVLIATLTSLNIAGGLDLCPRLVSGAIRVFVGLNSGSGRRIYRSDNAGATFSHVGTLPSTASSNGPSCLLVPYEGNTAGNLVWVGYPASATQKGIFKSINGGASWSAITLPSTATVNHETRIKRGGIEVYTQDSNQVAIWNDEERFFKSTDGGATFTEIAYTGYDNSVDGRVFGAGGYPYLGSRYYIVTNLREVFVSISGGEVWVRKTGNIKTAIPNNRSDSVWPFDGTIVPDWTE